MIKNLLLIGVSGIVGLLITEIVVRTTLPRPGFVMREEPAGLLIPHPRRSYAYAPGYSRLVATEEYEIHIDINSMGLRDDPIEADANVDILAIGDSFTIGFGVEADEAWPSQLESYLNTQSQTPAEIRVVNAGISGYSVAQIRLLLEDLLILEPKLVVLGLFSSRFWRINNPYIYFDGDAVLRKVVPNLKIVDGGFLESPIRNPRLKQVYFWLAENFQAGAYALTAVYELRSKLKRAGDPVVQEQNTRSVADKLKPMLAELDLMNQSLHRRGIALLVVAVNDQQPDGSFAAVDKQYNSLVKDFCLTNQVAFFDPLPVLESTAMGVPKYRIGKDHHWSKEAHALVGRELGAYLQQEKMFKQPTTEAAFEKSREFETGETAKPIAAHDR